MIKYLAKRMGRSLITLFFILTLVFILLRQMPIEGYFDNFDKLTEEQIQVGLEGMGLTDSMPVQLSHFFIDLIHGNLGVSRRYRSNVAVTEILATKIPISVKLGSMSILLSLLCGLPMGILMTKYKGKIFDKIGTIFIVFIQAVPAMVYFLFIQLYGTTLLKVPLLFDASNINCWILPVVSMSLGNTAYYGMWLRRYMVDESTKDYVKLAKAKGVSEGKIMRNHIFKNAFVPLIQYLPTSFLNTVVGSIYIESLYSVPGMGGLLVDVVKKNDNNMVQAIVLLYATVGVIGLLLGDILMTVVDPRISLSRKGGGR
jgi:ABC-type dipeptide/oligopeptide/nickel transport system permease component